MVTKFFKPEQFAALTGSYINLQEIASNIANSILEREGKVVYADNVEGDIVFTSDKSTSDTHRALLINIEPIEKISPTYNHAIDWESLKANCRSLEDLAQAVQPWLKTKPDVEPIEQCKHPEEKVQQRPDGLRSGGVYMCECGAKVKPSAFEVVDE